MHASCALGQSFGLALQDDPVPESRLGMADAKKLSTNLNGLNFLLPYFSVGSVLWPAVASRSGSQRKSFRVGTRAVKLWTVTFKDGGN
jgi:hypothetical protein